MRDLLENLREFKNIRKYEQNERLFLQLPPPQLNFDEKSAKKQEIGSKVIIIDLLESECPIQL